MLLLGVLLLLSQPVLTLPTESVLVLQDGGTPDDYMGVALLSRAANVQLMGDVLINGDGFLPWSADISSKVHQVAGIPEVPLVVSNARGFNAFPILYRGYVMKMAQVPSLNSINSTIAEPYPDGDDWLLRTLNAANDSSVTIVSTAGVTTLTNVLKAHPALQRKIKRIVWTAGAISAAGNLDKGLFEGFNGCAEWNVYWDAFAAAWLLESTDIQIDLLPLDISNQANPFAHPEFLETLKRSSTELGKVAFESYSLVITPEQQFVRLWDLVAAGYVARPDLYLSLIHI
eukprot:TRINITY_DN3536_c0_g1_i2.p1 TRINITY_DN3536_c0_g1~~TRINITY_DN3536_c0_g1_i2.p1  ORF type:complete len:287 (-),score=64.61 TRINITY_DN3536_c0_g1_i2:123-983(-)